MGLSESQTIFDSLEKLNKSNWSKNSGHPRPDNNTMRLSTFNCQLSFKIWTIDFLCFTLKMIISTFQMDLMEIDLLFCVRHCTKQILLDMEKKQLDCFSVHFSLKISVLDWWNWNRRKNFYVVKKLFLNFNLVQLLLKVIDGDAWCFLWN
jgi:hypothetical protein